jgi:hypothetical protein
MKEIHLLIDWDCFFDIDTIKKYLNDNGLELKKYFKHPKLENKIETMSKFYEVPVDDWRGGTEFNLYIIIDNNPSYNKRETSKGIRKVNVNIFDLKKSLRKITGGYRIHATDNIQETKDNLKALGIFDEYYNKRKFGSLQDVFDELNQHQNLKWVVMRNFEEMPHNITIDEHLDVDLLVNDYYLVKSILDGSSATKQTYENGGNRILNYVTINNNKVLFDFRSVGDNYYDKNFQIKMLNTRIKHPNGFYIPNEENHFYSLIYHSIIHKSNISSTYINVFKKYGLKDSELTKKTLKNKLDIFMEKNGYSYVKPEKSVGFFLKNI